MYRRILIVAFVLLFLIGACAPQAAPTIDAAGVQQTAEAAAFTMVAQTQAAQPTNTPFPPTETPSPTASPTFTAVPTLTVDPLLATATELPTLVPPTASQQSSGSAQDNCNKPLTSWKVPTANFTVINETKPEGKIVLSLYVETALGECGYLTDLSSGPVGMYSAGAFVDGKKNFKVFGGFQIQQGTWRIVVRNDKIVALGSCYPGC